MPLYVGLLLCVACLWAIAWLELRQSKRNSDNWSAIEQERLAREALRPSGNVERWP